MLKILGAIFAIIIVISLSGTIVDCAGFIGRSFGSLFGVLFVVGIIGFIITKLLNR